MAKRAQAPQDRKGGAQGDGLSDRLGAISSAFFKKYPALQPKVNGQIRDTEGRVWRDGKPPKGAA